MNLRALLELMRVSNLPTVWSNVVLGWFAGVTVPLWVSLGSDHVGLIAAIRRELIQRLPETAVYRLLPLAAVFSLFYVGGMILNDYLDRRIDTIERPQRPIPSGRVSPRLALFLSVLCLGGGLVGMSLFEWNVNPGTGQSWYGTIFAGVLVGQIVFYNLNHLDSPATSVVLMGQCRAFIVISAAAVIQPPTVHWAWWLFVLGPAVTLFAYTVVISMVARREVDPERGGFGGPRTIMNMIAAMPLLDAAWLVAMGLWPASLVCVACAGLTKLGHRRIAGS
ncbi:MAG: UbiA family prenyltransferase [Planctomycetota bacterium]